MWALCLDAVGLFRIRMPSRAVFTNRAQGGPTDKASSWTP